jgi:LPXTG-motif cell wall-anchored protein
VISASATDEEEKAETAAASQWWISVAIGAAVIAVLGFVFRKQRKQKRKHIKL